MKVKFWLNFSMKIKINIIGFFIILLFAVVTFFYVIPRFEKSIYERKKETVQHVVNSAISIIDKVYKDYKNDLYSEEEAKSLALSLVESIRYGEESKDYLWINDFEPVMLMHPYSKNLNGTNISKIKDRAGVFLFNEFVKVCSTPKGEGFVQYFWQYKDDKNRIVPKISFVKKYGNWDWIIGSGIYIEDVKEELRAVSLVIIIAYSIIIILSLLILYRFSVGLTNSIHKLQRNLERAREGDLRKNINFEGKDEIGMMLNAFNEFIIRIREVIKEVKISAEHMAASSDELSVTSMTFAKNSQNQAASTEEMTASIEYVSSGVDNISGEANDQFEKLKDLVLRIDELNSELKDMNELAEKTQVMTDDISNQTKSGEDAINRMSSNMKKISTSSQEMKKIIGIINEISDKINLLALNAAIEAARAGDAGRGFAVVSDEISKLADQTAQSLKSIGSLINENESEIHVFSSNVDEILNVITSIINGISSIDEMMDNVVKTMNLGLETNESVRVDASQLKAKSEVINNSTTEQKEALFEVVKTISSINDVISTSSASSEEIAGNAEELSGIAETLRNKVDYFKIDGQEEFDNKEDKD